MQRRHLLAAGCAALSPTALFAQATGKPIRLIVPFPPGGATDITARSVGEQLGKELNQTVIVENRAGAGGSIGMAELARSAPDGLSLGIATLSTHGVNPAVYKQLPYDAEKGFTPVAELVRAPGVLVVSAAAGIKDYAGFVAALKANPGKLSYASPGNGTIGHMWAELFKSSTGTFMLHVPYRGAAPAITDLIAGQVQAYFDQVASSLAHIKSGKVKALAVSWPQRLDILPDVPTFAELGLASNNVPSWFGLLAPAGTPDDIVSRLHAGVVKALRAPGMKERLAQMALYPSELGSPAQFGVQIRKEIDRMQKVSRYAKVQIDQ
jgi:tripartite-type tricarboxylate transporter receptor subunit TctC